ALLKITLRVNEAHADQRQAEVTGLLAMIPGENAEAAGIDRKRDVQPEFGRKIGDRIPGQIRMLFTKPRPSRRQGFVKSHHDAVVMAEERGIGSGRLQLGGRDLLQEFDRIVMGQLPQSFIQVLKKPARVRLPTPPQVIGQLSQTPDASRRRTISSLCAHFQIDSPPRITGAAQRFIEVGENVKAIRQNGSLRTYASCTLPNHPEPVNQSICHMKYEIWHMAYGIRHMPY